MLNLEGGGVNQSREQNGSDLKALWLEKKAKRDEALQWLCERFPEVFHWKNPKPLKIGILKDLLALRLEERKDLSRLNLQMALSFYTSRVSYLRAVVGGDQRFDLVGNPVEEIQKDHKEDAQKRLNKREQVRSQEVKSDPKGDLCSS